MNALPVETFSTHPAYAAQATALQTSNAGLQAFLCGLSVLVCPLLEAVVDGKRQPAKVVVNSKVIGSHAGHSELSWAKQGVAVYPPAVGPPTIHLLSKVWVAAGLATSGIAAIELGAVAGGGAGLGGGDLIGLVCSRSAS